jgi:hypothetical protein
LLRAEVAFFVCGAAVVEELYRPVVVDEALEQLARWRIFGEVVFLQFDALTFQVGDRFAAGGSAGFEVDIDFFHRSLFPDPPCIGRHCLAAVARGGFGRVLGEHFLNIGCAAPAAMAGGCGGALRDLIERAGAFADCALDRLIFDVVAPADGFEAADGRMQRLIFALIHSGRG